MSLQPYEFMALMLAREAFRRADLLKAAKQGGALEPLLLILQNGSEFDKSLANMLSGKWHNANGRPPLTQKAKADYSALLREAKHMRKQKVSEPTVLTWLLAQPAVRRRNLSRDTLKRDLDRKSKP
jgi:hypothetical protein